MPYAKFSNDVFKESGDIGAVHAAYVIIEDKDKRVVKRGWVSCGNYWNRAQVVKLSDSAAIAMTIPGPKKFSSDIDIIQDKSVVHKNVILSVNEPFEFKGWRFYQSSYNNKFGRWSDISIVELVKDPWLPVVYVGFFMVLVGTLYLLWTGRTFKKNKL